MSENINLRPISELPEVETVSAGDKLILNSGGEAKLIDESKVGGSGGGGRTIYARTLQVSEDLTEIIVLCHADEALTQPLTYEAGKKLLIAGAGTYGSLTTNEGDINVSINPSIVLWDQPFPNAAMGIIINPQGSLSACILAFSDTVLD